MTTVALVTPARNRSTYILEVLSLAALVMLSMWAWPSLRLAHDTLPPLLPGSGVAFAGLLLLGPRAWPGVLLGSLGHNLLSGLPAPASFGFALGTVVTAGVPAWLARWRRQEPLSLDRLRDVVVFLLTGAGLGPLIGAGLSLLGAGASRDGNPQLALAWFVAVLLATMSACVVVAAPLYAFLGPSLGPRRRGSLLEALGLVAGFGVAMSLTRSTTPLYALLSFPLLAWASLRFGTRGAGLAAIATYLLSAQGMPQERVALSGLDLSLFYALLLGTAGAMGLFLAASAAERNRARANELLADDQYRALLTSSPLAIIGLDPAGRVSAWSVAAERLFGWSAAEVMGDQLPNLPPESREGQARLPVAGAAPLDAVETVRLRRDGTRLNVLLHTWPLQDEAGRFAGSVVALQDITERKQAERLQSAVYRIAQAALAAEDLDALYLAIHGIVSELMPARSLYIATYDAATETVSFPYFVDEVDPPPAPRRARKGLTEYVLRTGHSLRDRPKNIDSLVMRGEVESFGSDPEDWLGVPLAVGGTTIGVLAVQSYDRGVRYSERDQSILEFVSAQIAMAIQRRRAEAAQRATAEELAALFAAMPDVIVVFDQEGTFLKVAPTRSGYRFRPVGEVVGRRMSEVLPAPLADEATRAVRTALAERRPVSIEYELSIGDVPQWFSGTASPLGPDRVVWVARNITPVKEAQRLEQAVSAVARVALEGASLEEVFAQLHQSVAALMPARNCYVALLEGDRITFPYWVDEREGPQLARVRGTSYTDWVLRHGRPLRYRESLRTGVPAPTEATLLGITPVDWMAAPLTLGERTIGALAVQTYEAGSSYTERDERLLELLSSQVAFAIERARAEEAIRRSEERFRVLAATASDIIYDWDPRTGREWWSENITGILGYLPQEIRFERDDWQRLLHPDEADRLLQSWRQVEASGSILWREEYRIRRRDGSWAWVLDRARLEHDSAGAVVRVIGAMLDITGLREAREALRRSEDQLRQAVKMEAVGRLAGGVAHDFNNLLTSVLGHADLALNSLPAGDPLQDDLQEIKAAGTRAAALTQQLLAFSRKQVLEPRVIDLNRVVSGISRMLRRTIGEDVILVTRLAPDLGPVRADPVQMEQVLINLAVNARDAMPDGGRLTIETSNVHLSGGPGVRIRVEDTGVGMSDEVRVHLFEPFFTTKEVGKGTGLGLATAYGVVEQSGGTITVTSAVGKGTTFVIDLPQVRAEDPAPAPVALPVGTRGSGSILLVEDEDAVRSLTRRVLEQHGYTVLSAPNAESALELSRSHRGEIHLLLTDVVMPGMSGARLAEVLLAERSGLRCLFMSGYAASALGATSVLQSEGRFLQKPFTTAQLLERLRSLLAGREGAD